ncbi:capsule assembly Wzi family protein [Hymenobacter sp. HDW8]|nr:capsule assembly Wzi family protein [Hymenobacter sp. HDW8]
MDTLSAKPAVPAQPQSDVQGTTYVPLDSDVYRLIDRYTILFGPDSLNDPHTSVRPYTRASVARLAERILRDSTTVGITRADRFNADYLLRDNWQYTKQDIAANTSKKPVLGRFYRNQSDFFHVETPSFTLRVNPVANLSVGRDTDIDGLRYLNTRGVQVEGTIDEKLGFYTFLADNQTAAPFYVQQRVLRDNIVPHEAFWKTYKNRSDQYDFLSGRGYLTYAASKHINLQFGYDRNTIGNGYRSLILSDYAAPYLFLKVNTRIWKFNYQNLFAEMTAEKANQDTIYQKKYFALHHLSLDLAPNFNVGVFESVVFGRGKGRYELQYLNPIIFYRSVEQAIGSNDNALLGLDFKWNIKRRLQLYGQVVLDEFVISEARAGKGSWRNKQSVQLGGRYINVAGIQNLDFQGEVNYIRPYTYQHLDQYRNYQHYNQPLAHPMGGNLVELLGIISYQPLPRLNLVAKGFYTVQGNDVVDENGFLINYGGNVRLPYTNRPLLENGNVRTEDFRVGDGIQTNLIHTDFTATYQARHNVWLDAKLIMRRVTSPDVDNITNSTVYPSLAFRWNIAQRLHEF